MLLRLVASRFSAGHCWNKFSFSNNRCLSSSSSRKRRKMDYTQRLIWIDCEMTGLDLQRDQLLEVALIITDSELNTIDQLDSLHIHASKQVLDSMNDWCRTHFAANGLTEQCLRSQLTIEQVDDIMSDFLIKNQIKRGILAGNSIATDRLFIEKYCPKFSSNLHYRMVDVSAVKVLVDLWYHDRTLWNKPTQHRALSDIQQSIDELRYYQQKYFIVPTSKLET